MIITAGHIITLDGDNIKDGAVVVHNRFIKYTGKKDKALSLYPDEQKIEMADSILFPGFVNAHIHLEYSSFKISDGNINFTDWLPQIIQKAKSFSASDWQKSVEKGLEEIKKTGTTTIADISRSNQSFDLLSKAHLNSIIFHELVALDDEAVESGLSDTGQKINSIHSQKHDRIYSGLSPHSVYTLSLNALQKISEFAKTHSLPLMIHVSESLDEQNLVINNSGRLKEIMSKSRLNIKYGYGKTPVKILAENNILRPNTILVHGVHLNDEDIELIAQFKAGIVLCPGSNAFLNAGTPPVEKLLKANICLALGTDSLSSNTSFDMFKEIRKIKDIYPEINHEYLLKMATLNGAELLKISSLTGTITHGKYADIAGIRIKPECNPAQLDPIEYLCENGNPEDISLCIAGGERII